MRNYYLENNLDLSASLSTRISVKFLPVPTLISSLFFMANVSVKKLGQYFSSSILICWYASFSRRQTLALQTVELKIVWHVYTVEFTSGSCKWQLKAICKSWQPFMCLSSWVPIACVASTSVDFSSFLRDFAFWLRQIKASAKKRNRERGGGGEERQKRKCLPAKVCKTPL